MILQIETGLHIDRPTDPFAAFKAAQRQMWSTFAGNEGFTTPPAAHLVAFAGLAPGEEVLDVACGTGVVAITAARAGAIAQGLDLTPALLERARSSASMASLDVEFAEGDVEALPYGDASFDVVLSQFGHMFAPRPDVAVAEMLRVLRPGGRIAFTTWPPDGGLGRIFALVARMQPVSTPSAASVLWGDRDVVRARLGDRVRDLVFEVGAATAPALSPHHMLAYLETTLGPLAQAVAGLHDQPEALARLRLDVSGILGEGFAGNEVRQPFLLSRAVKRS